MERKIDCQGLNWSRDLYALKIELDKTGTFIRFFVSSNQNLVRLTKEVAYYSVDRIFD